MSRDREPYFSLLRKEIIKQWTTRKKNKFFLFVEKRNNQTMDDEEKTNFFQDEKFDYEKQNALEKRSINFPKLLDEAF